MIAQQKINYFILLFVFLLTSLASTAQPNFNQTTPNQQNFLETIPFHFIANRIIIQATIEGKEGRFLLDTGTPTILSKKFYQQLDLPEAGYINVRDATNQVQQQPYTFIPKMALGQAEFSNTTALVIDFEQTPIVEEELEIDGMIGSNLFRNIAVQLDLEKQQLVLTDKIERLKLGANKALKMKLDNSNRPYLTLKIEGKKDKVLFDTGFPDVYVMTAFFYKKYEQLWQPYIISKDNSLFTYEGIYGNEATLENLPLLRLPSIQIGDKKVEKVVVSPSYFKEALLGTELLKYGKVTLDFVKKRFYF